MSNKTQSYSRRLYNSSIAAVINGKLVTEVLALSSYSLYAMDHPRLGVKQVPFVSLRIQPSHLAPCRSECFAGETSTIEISHWWRTMYLESDQELQLIDVLIMFCTNDKQATKGRKGQMETRWIYYKIVIIRWIYSFYHNWVISRRIGLVESYVRKQHRRGNDVMVAQFVFLLRARFSEKLTWTSIKQFSYQKYYSLCRFKYGSSYRG